MTVLRKLPLIAVAAALPLLPACKKKDEAPAPPPVAAPAVPQDLLQKGKAVFDAKCAVCHKVQGA